MNRAYKPLQNQWQRWMPARSRPMKGVLFYSIAIWINCLGTGMFSPFSLLYFHSVATIIAPSLFTGLLNFNPSAPWLVLALATGIASVVIYLVRNLLLTPRMAQ